MASTALPPSAAPPVAAGAIPPTVPAPIRRQLDRLRGAVRRWQWADGLARLAVATIPLAAVSFVVDHTLRMDRLQRAVCLALGLAALGVLAYRRLLRPLAQRLSDDDLAQAAESRHPELRQRMLSALELARLADPEALGSSPAMVQATIEAGARAAEDVRLHDVLDRRTLARNAAILLACVAVWTTVGLLAPRMLKLWAARNVLLSRVAWPQATHLTLLDTVAGELVCPRGDDLAVRVRAAGVVPAQVSLHYRQANGSGVEPMLQEGEDVFRVTFRNVLDAFTLRALGGDGDTPWQTVRLVERPAVDALELVCNPPAYVPGGPQRLAIDVGSYPVLLGSTLTVEGRASKDLQQAQLVLGKESPQVVELTGPRMFRFALSGTRLQTGTYGVSLVDRDGYASRQPARLSVRVVPDQKPVVRARLEGIGDLLLAKAVIPLHVRATDDYAVQSVELVIRSAQEGKPDAPPQRRPFGSRRDLLGLKQVELDDRLELEPLGLAVGAHLLLQIEAHDNDTVSGPKSGTSSTFSFRVVAEEELRSELLRREQEQRLEFERLLRDQQKLQENSQALAAVLAQAAPGPTPKDRDQLLAWEKQQRQVGGRAQGIADQFTRILAEVENNRLEADPRPARERLQRRIAEPLARLAKRDVTEAADLLDSARKALPAGPGDLASTKQTLAEALSRQEHLTAAMREILRHMVKWEGYQEAINLLRDVLKAQKDVGEETHKEQQRRIQKVFE